MSHSPFRILVRCADHLGKIDDYWFAIFATNEDIELIEIAMNEACTSESNDYVHKSGVQFSR